MAFLHLWHKGGCPQEREGGEGKGGTEGTYVCMSIYYIPCVRGDHGDVFIPVIPLVLRTLCECCHTAVWPCVYINVNVSLFSCSSVFWKESIQIGLIYGPLWEIA